MKDEYLEETRRYLQPLVNKVSAKVEALSFKPTFKLDKYPSKYVVETKLESNSGVVSHQYATCTRSEFKPTAIRLLLTELLFAISKRYGIPFFVGVSMCHPLITSRFSIEDYTIVIEFNTETDKVELHLYCGRQLFPPQEVSIEELADVVEGLSLLMFEASKQVDEYK
jgi:hypothetical protein